MTYWNFAEVSGEIHLHILEEGLVNFATPSEKKNGQTVMRYTRSLDAELSLIKQESGTLPALTEHKRNGPKSGTSFYAFDLMEVTVHVERQKFQSLSDIKQNRKKMGKYHLSRVEPLKHVS